MVWMSCRRMVGVRACRRPMCITCLCLLWMSISTVLLLLLLVLLLLVLVRLCTFIW